MTAFSHPTPMSTFVLSSRRTYWLLGVSIFINIILVTQYYRPSYNSFEPSQAPALSQPRHEEFPKKIWQSWKDDSESPTDRSSGLPHEWRLVNPEYRYERITDANADTFVRDHFPTSTSERFASLPDPILKADFLRYLILYSDGGVWADIDVKPVRPISEWVPAQYRESTVNLVVGIENDHHKQPIWSGSPYSVQLAQYTVLAKPGHPVIGDLIAKVEQNLEQLFESKGEGDRITFAEVMSNTGPFVFTDVLMKHFSEVTGTKHTGNEMDRLEEPILIGDVLVLPKDAFGWLEHEHRMEDGADPLVLVKHLFMGSWREGHPG